jgi:hypothetical protein
MPMEKVEFEFPSPENEKKEADEKEQVKSTDDSGSDIEVEVVDDTPPQDRGKKPAEPPAEVTDEELAEYSEKVRKRIQHFTRGYHDERRRAEAAEREREEAVRYAQSIMEENKKLRETHDKTQTALIEQAKARAGIELEQAKKAYRDAYESGDSDRVVAAQEALITAKNRAEKLANWKPAPLQQKETPVQTQQPAPESKVDTRALEWQKSNPWFGQDDEMTSLALGLHQKLVRDGVNPQSDEYYAKINRRMRQLFPEKFDGEEEVEVSVAAEKPKRANVVAPATRSTAPTKIKLTDSAVKLAKRLGLSPEQYARQVAEDMRKQNG